MMKLVNESTRLTTMFNTFNEKYFDNKVNVFEVGFAKRKSYVWCGKSEYYKGKNLTKYGHGYVIKINPLLRGSHYEGILLREMIKVYLYLYISAKQHTHFYNHFVEKISKESGINIRKSVPDIFFKERKIKSSLKLKPIVENLF